MMIRLRGLLTILFYFNILCSALYKEYKIIHYLQFIMYYFNSFYLLVHFM